MDRFSRTVAIASLCFVVSAASAGFLLVVSGIFAGNWTELFKAYATILVFIVGAINACLTAVLAREQFRSGILMEKLKSTLADDVSRITSHRAALRASYAAAQRYYSALRDLEKMEIDRAKLSAAEEEMDLVRTVQYPYLSSDESMAFDKAHQDFHYVNESISEDHAERKILWQSNYKKLAEHVDGFLRRSKASLGESQPFA